MTTTMNDIENARTVNLLVQSGSFFLWGQGFSYEFALGDVLDAVTEATRNAILDACDVMALEDDVLAVESADGPDYASDCDRA